MGWKLGMESSIKAGLVAWKLEYELVLLVLLIDILYWAGLEFFFLSWIRAFFFKLIVSRGEIARFF